MDAHLRNLRYFVAVAEELHFTRAAERLHVSQPALSKQIALLERDFGFPLFRRDRRTVALTGAGEALLDPTREMLAGWDDAVDRAARRAGEDAALLRVGFHTSVAGGLYKDAAAIFAAGHEGWTLALRLCPWSDATAGLLDGTSDVAFLWLPVPDGQQLAWRALRSEPRHVALWRSHPLADRSELRMSELHDEPFIALPPAAGALRDYWLALDERRGHPVRIGAQAESPDATFEAVAARQGVVLLAAGNAELYARTDIVSRPVIDLSPCELVIAWRRADTRHAILDFSEAAVLAAAR